PSPCGAGGGVAIATEGGGGRLLVGMTPHPAAATFSHKGRRTPTAALELVAPADPLTRPPLRSATLSPTGRGKPQAKGANWLISHARGRRVRRPSVPPRARI